MNTLGQSSAWVIAERAKRKLCHKGYLVNAEKVSIATSTQARERNMVSPPPSLGHVILWLNRTSSVCTIIVTICFMLFHCRRLGTKKWISTEFPEEGMEMKSGLWIAEVRLIVPVPVLVRAHAAIV